MVGRRGDGTSEGMRTHLAPKRPRSRSGSVGLMTRSEGSWWGHARFRGGVTGHLAGLEDRVVGIEVVQRLLDVLAGAHRVEVDGEEGRHFLEELVHPLRRRQGGHVLPCA